MIWIARLIFALGILSLLDFLYAVIGLLLIKFSYRKHPRLHRAGLRLMAMSLLTCNHALPRCCEMCCGVDECKNWSCPGQVFYKENPRD